MLQYEEMLFSTVAGGEGMVNSSEGTAGTTSAIDVRLPLLMTNVVVPSVHNLPGALSGVRGEWTDETYLLASNSLRGISLYDQLLFSADRLLYFAQMNWCSCSAAELALATEPSFSNFGQDITADPLSCASRELRLAVLRRTTARLLERAYRLLCRAKVLLAEVSIGLQRYFGVAR
jgi:hypothetical protein